MSKLKTYLAGAMGCYGAYAEYPKAWRKAVEEYFRAHSDNIKCINPVNYYEYGANHHQTEKEIMRFDLRKVKEADIILVNLKDLDKSPGTSDEIFLGWYLDKPVIGFLETECKLVNKDFTNYLHNWKIEQLDRIETGENAMVKAMDYILDYYG